MTNGLSTDTSETIQRMSAQITARSASAAGAPVIYPERHMVLVVDDEPAVRQVIARVLSSEGYTCVQADSRASALEALASSEFSLVMLDLGLGDDDGMLVLDQIHRQNPDTAVIMVTANDDVAIARASLLRGATTYVRKPFGDFELRVHAYGALVQRATTQNARADRTDQDRAVRRRIPCQLAERLASASRARDAETGAHVERIGRMSAILACALGLTTDEAELIGVAATAHDVGKIAIPDAILRKPGKLTPEEMEIMKQHTVQGARILDGTDIPVLELAEQIALGHHEHWDGGGYPHGSVGGATPLAARIVAIVDVYDALVHARVYKAAWEESRVLALLEEQRGKQFEPRIVDAFLRALPAIRHVCSILPDEA